MRVQLTFPSQDAAGWTGAMQGLIAFSISARAYTERDKALRGKSLATTDHRLYTQIIQYLA